MNHWLDVYRLVNDYDDIDIWVPHEFNEMAGSLVSTSERCHGEGVVNDL